MPRTSWSKMQAFPIPILPDGVRSAFNAIVQPMHDKIMETVSENRGLAETRDYLLPKLMSGEICANKAEALVA